MYMQFGLNLIYRAIIYGAELVIDMIYMYYNFLPLGSIQREPGSFGGKAFHQVYVEQFGSWLLEMTYTLLMVSFCVCYLAFTCNPFDK